jgi:hypothetical protein
MKTKFLNPLLVLLISSSATHFSLQAAAVKPTYTNGPLLPEIWEKAGPQERLKALRAAELDGDRLLAERIYGILVEAGSNMQDQALEKDTISGAVEATIKGVYTDGEPDYQADGEVQVVRAIKIKEITDTINRVVKAKKLEDGSFVTISDRTNDKLDTNNKVIDVTGSGALPGSEGQQKLMAKRAAELDAYRRLAGRIMGVKVQGDTTVRDFVLQNDKVASAIAHEVDRATPTAVNYFKDGDCSVTMEIKIDDVIRTTERVISKGIASKTTVSDSIETKTLSETGRGSMRPVAAAKTPGIAGNDSSTSSNIDPAKHEQVITEIIRELVKSGPILQ